jgi:hypothetical protein
MRSELRDNIPLTAVQVTTLGILSLNLAYWHIGWQALLIIILLLLPYLFIAKARIRLDVLFLDFVLLAFLLPSLVPKDLKVGGGPNIFYWIFIALFVLIVFALDTHRERQPTLIITLLIGICFAAVPLFFALVS